MTDTKTLDSESPEILKDAQVTLFLQGLTKKMTNLRGLANSIVSDIDKFYSEQRKLLQNSAKDVE